MLNKDDIIKILNENDIFADNFILDAFIKNWKIEAIYEDEKGVEYFDETALIKIKNALGNKDASQELYTVETIKKEEPKPVVETKEDEIKAFEEEDYDDEDWEETPSEKPEVKEEIPVAEPVITKEAVAVDVEETPIEAVSVEPVVEVMEEKPTVELVQRPETELKNFTLDITNQTLSVLAQAIAEKITVDVSEYLKRTEFIEEAVNLGMFKKDNEIMATKINELIQDNKVLIKKLQELENIENQYVQVFGNIYVKK